MRFIIAAFCIIACVAPSFSQSAKLPNILQPDPEIQKLAREEGVETFKLLPRGLFDYEKNELSLRGGGAYYSFSTGSHDYNKIPQIELQQDRLSTGFYGTNYGFIADIGDFPLSGIDSNLEEVSFLSSYIPPKAEREVRAEAMRFHRFETGSLTFVRGVPAVLGKTYVMRSISFGEADLIVAFRVAAAHEDGSITIIWKKIKTLPTPEFERDNSRTK